MERLDYMWAQIYRPRTLDEIILPDHLKSEFKKYVENKSIPSLLFYSPSAGTGKTTSALALAHDIGCNHPLKINASMETSIDVIRTDVKKYCMQYSIFDDADTKKVVILDEFDRMTVQAQEALKGFMEEMSKTTAFIITTNNKDKIIEPLIDRCINHDFIWDEETSRQLSKQMCMRCLDIFKQENVECDIQVLATVVKKCVPSFRKVLNELQRYATQCNNKIDAGILAQVDKSSVDKLVEYIIGKKFKELGQWAADNKERGDIFHILYPAIRDKVELNDLPSIVVTINDYDRDYRHVSNKWLHLYAMFVTIAANLD